MGTITHQALQLVVRSGPITQTTLGIEVPTRAGVHQFSAPGRGEQPGSLGRAEGVIAAGKHDRFERQRALRHGCPAGQQLAHIVALCIGRRYQQCAFDTVRISGVGSPCRNVNAAQAVRHQHCGPITLDIAGQQHLFKPRNPVAAQGPHPVVLLHT
jgi:hypothetical protein